MLIHSISRKVSLLPIILIALIAFTQEVTPQNKKAGEVKTDLSRNSLLESPLRARARDLAASTAYEAFKWDDHRATVRVVSQAADLLWSDDPDRSRMWLKRAWELTDDLDYKDANNTVGRYRSSSPRAGARAIILAVARRRDALLFNGFLEQLAGEKEKSRDEYRRGIFDERTARSEQLLSLALANAESDPAMAASLAEQSLEDGVSFRIQSVLLALRRHDEDASNRVLDAALNHLATSFRNPSEGQIIASYLFTPGRVVGVGSDNVIALAIDTQIPTFYMTPAEADPTRARRFLTIMQQIMVSMPSPSTTTNPSLYAQEFVALSNSLSGGFKRYAPELWLPIEQRSFQMIPDLESARANNRLTTAVKDKLLAGHLAGLNEKKLNSLYVEGLEDAADAENDPIARKLAYVQAALTTSPDDLTSGRRIVAKIQENELREQVLSFLVYRTALTKLERGQLDEAINLALEANPTQRALVLITAAQRLATAQSKKIGDQNVNSRIQALDLLLDAERILKQCNNSIEELHIRLGFIAALAPLDPIRAFNYFNDVVMAINKTNSFDPTDTSAPRIAGLDSFSAQALLPQVRSGYGIKDALMPLVNSDFESSVHAAGKLSAPTVRGICMLEIAQIILGEEMEGSVATKHTALNNIPKTRSVRTSIVDYQK